MVINSCLIYTLYIQLAVVNIAECEVCWITPERYISSYQPLVMERQKWYISRYHTGADAPVCMILLIIIPLSAMIY